MDGKKNKMERPEQRVIARRSPKEEEKSQESLSAPRWGLTIQIPERLYFNMRLMRIAQPVLRLSESIELGIWYSTAAGRCELR